MHEFPKQENRTIQLPNRQQRENLNSCREKFMRSRKVDPKLEYIFSEL